MHVLATAGHVDHGKSTLVRALTGIDPDRLAEEKERGLTIDLGFAWMSLPSGRDVSLIDVPGHVRFLKNMLAGVGAIDACVFVVAATEGWKPQSEEHLRILDLLGVEHGMVALTKVDLVDDDLLELAILDVEEHVAGTFLDGAPIVGVDAPSGRGIHELTAALDTVLADTPTASDDRRPRMWIDRSFAAKGSGTVVTGTLTGGRLRVDDELVVLPQRRTVRVRAVQSRKADRTKVGPGNRVALNLVGIAHDEVGRGDVVVINGQWQPTTRFDASLTVLDAIDHDVSRRGAFLVYLGSGEHPARLRVLGPSSLAPGETGAVRIHLPQPVPLLPGDRFILRDAGRGETVGGGEVLDIDPVVAAARARPDRSVDRVVAERGWVDVDHLERLTGARRPPTLGDRWIVDPLVLAADTERLRDAVTGAGPLGLDLAGLNDRDRAVLATIGGITVEAGRAKLAGTIDDLGSHPWLVEARAARFAPPDPAGISRQELRELVRRGEILELDGQFFAAPAAVHAALAVARLLRDKPAGFTVSEFRQALGNTRKHAMPLLAHLDATGVTRRRADLRLGGPRLPSLD